MNSTFEIFTEPQTGQQIWESKEHNLQVWFEDFNGPYKYFEGLVDYTENHHSGNSIRLIKGN